MVNNKRNRKQKRGVRRIAGNADPDNTVVSNMPSLCPFPPTITRNFNYSDLISLVEGTPSYGVYQLYRTADVYDPDYTGTGHQPMYFDQLCSSTGPYLNHTTHSVVFQVRVVNTSSVPVMCIAYPTMVTTAPNRTAALERPYAWKQLLPPTGTGGSSVTKTIKLDNTRFVALSKAAFEVAYAGTHNASSPSPYMMFAFFGVGASVASVILEVNIVYKSKFFQLGNIATS